MSSALVLLDLVIATIAFGSTMLLFRGIAAKAISFDICGMVMPAAELAKPLRKSRRFMCLDLTIL